MLSKELAEQYRNIDNIIIRKQRESQERKREEDLIDFGAGQVLKTQGMQGMIDYYKQLDPKKGMSIEKDYVDMQSKMLQNKKGNMELVNNSMALLGGMGAKLEMISDPKKQQELLTNGVLPLAKQLNVDIPKNVDKAMPLLRMMAASQISPKDQADAETAYTNKYIKDAAELKKYARNNPQAAKAVVKQMEEKKDVLESGELKDIEAFSKRSDEKTKKLQETVDGLRSIDLLLKDINDVSLWKGTAAQTFMARATGNTGVLTEQDFQRAGAVQVPQRMINFLNNLSGNPEAPISPEVLKDMRQYADELKLVIGSKIEEKYNDRLSLAKAAGFKLQHSMPEYSRMLFTKFQQTPEYQQVKENFIKANPEAAKNMSPKLLEETIKDYYLNNKVLGQIR